MAHPGNYASRANQLDATALDHELCLLLKTKVKEVLQYLQPKLLVKLEPELESLLKLLVYKWTLVETASTVGQTLLDLEYQDVRTGRKINSKKAWAFVFLSVGIPWLKNKLQHALYATNSIPNPAIVSLVDKLEVVFRLASLANFLIFLQQGWYSSLVERILQVRSVHGAPKLLRQVQFDYMNRELLWHGFAEFLSFVLPLINFHQLKNMILRLVSKPPAASYPVSLERPQRCLQHCAICGKWPVHPTEIGCSHVYCYYCIKTNVMVDPDFCCLVCNQAVPDGGSTEQSMKAVIIPF